VRELDAPAALAARRGDLDAALDEIVAAFGAEGGASAGASGLMDLAPPGIDELLGVLGVVEAEKHYELIVVDTAPTGHALRLLEMPDAAREWVQVLMRVLLKYRTLVRPGHLAAELIELSRSIHRLQTLLHDPHAARFIVVTRAAELPRLETERLIVELRRLRLAAPAVIINAATLAPRSCPRCRAIAAAEHGVIAELTRACRRPRRDCVIILTPLAAPPPRGVVALDRWSRGWIA
jgi:arsenite-transporting ATPase